MSIEVVLHGPRDAFWARSEEQQSGSLALLTLLALVALVRLALRGWANPFVFIRCNQSSGDANPLRAPRSFPCAKSPYAIGTRPVQMDIWRCHRLFGRCVDNTR
jgi:hypothetical protein